MSEKERLQELELIRKALEGLAQNQSEKYSVTHQKDGDDSYDLQDQSQTANRSTRDNEMTNLLVDSKIATLEVKIVEKLSDIQSDFMGKYSEISTKISESRPNYVLIFLGTVVGIILAIVGLMFVVFPVYNENYWVNHKESYIEELGKAVEKKILPQPK